jgi:hypothetical protein
MNIVTFSGAVINPLAPNADAICLEDIAHALANICRFTGHTRTFYSVSQHSVLCSNIVAAKWRLTALMHDASEAYLSDVSRPIKRDPEFGAFYREFEQQLERVIAEKFGLVYPYPPAVKFADDVLLRSEQRDLMPNVLRVPGDAYLDYRIEPWLPAEAEERFLARFRELV